MNKQGIFVMGLIGSILGILGSIVWLFIGTFFYGGMIDYDNPSDDVSDAALGLGLIFSFLQSGITISGFIITLVKSTPGSMEKKGLRNAGIWLLVVGIVCLVMNLFNLIPAILIIVAGALAIGSAKSNNGEIRVETNNLSNGISLTKEEGN
ncbi:hypothetical protein [Bacillus sp. FJAT-49736]|uniref:hypothetical protein n=1 Tax=Bacillus sp. FJAT-49736 TaxID=2833582 RepID=UPI001BCA281A|nr:hypothetical protein [Bacillus sp. FJAT-49736]MBS4174232.1 hypothetical protein [Bacillus sp. FJAT-49736]